MAIGLVCRQATWSVCPARFCSTTGKAAKPSETNSSLIAPTIWNWPRTLDLIKLSHCADSFILALSVRNVAR